MKISLNMWPDLQKSQHSCILNHRFNISRNTTLKYSNQCSSYSYLLHGCQNSQHMQGSLIASKYNYLANTAGF